MKPIHLHLLAAGALVPMVTFAQPRNGPGGPGGPGPGPGPVAPRNAPLQPFAESWLKADPDKDGFITREEFDQLPRLTNVADDKRKRLFQRLDKDEDGRLSRDELTRLRKTPENTAQPMKRLWELDTDKSGGVDFEEFKTGHMFMKLNPERQKAVFDRLDTNHDGTITPADRPVPPHLRKPNGGQPPQPNGGGDAPPPPPGGRDARNPDRPHQGPGGPPQGGRGPNLRTLDQNGDGEVNFEEFRQAPANQRLDEDEQEDRFEALDRDGDLKLSGKELSPTQEGARPGPPPARPQPGQAASAPRRNAVPPQ
jgi:Ca2+-binding EF-hand superfamily protein